MRVYREERKKGGGREELKEEKEWEGVGRSRGGRKEKEGK